MHESVMQPQDPLKNIELKRSARHKLPTGVLDIATRPGAEMIYAACMDGVYRLDPGTGEHRRLTRHRSYSSGVVCLPEAPMLITAGFDGALLWFDLQRESLVRRVQAHQFWSWQMALSPDGRHVASVTGQYLAGGIKYEPAPEREPSVRVYDAQTGDLCHGFSHVPSVQSVAFSPDSRFVAAANLMGEVRIWDLDTGERVAEWTTDAFTSWGIIKSHCYIGGVFALQFTSDGQHLLLAGMGPMRDPMAGNGKQLWQKFAWQDDPPKLVDQTHEGQGGEGLMETLSLHGTGAYFLMGGRLRGGKWNAALFSTGDGDLLHSVNSGYRMTGSAFSPASDQLFTCGSFKQPRPKGGTSDPFGVVDIYDIQASPAADKA